MTFPPPLLAPPPPPTAYQFCSVCFLLQCTWYLGLRTARAAPAVQQGSPEPAPHPAPSLTVSSLAFE